MKFPPEGIFPALSLTLAVDSPLMFVTMRFSCIVVGIGCCSKGEHLVRVYRIRSSFGFARHITT